MNDLSTEAVEARKQLNDIFDVQENCQATILNPGTEV